MKRNKILSYVLFVMMTTLFACSESDYYPKPYGYFRIEFPERKYKTYASSCPFEFQHPVYSTVSFKREVSQDSCWLNLDFPKYNARTHLTYKPIQNNLDNYLEDCYKMARDHQIKASSMETTPILIDSNNVYGLVYNIKGNVATSLQFYVTDSINHFLRGSLYFNSKPNVDSIAPVLDFIRDDIYHLFQTLEWH